MRCTRLISLLSRITHRGDRRLRPATDTPVCDVTAPQEIRLLRRLLCCGEWIESHALHIFLLHAPDFLGYPGAIEMAADHSALVQQGLHLKKAGNALMTLVGGRSIHPVNVRIGGFYRLPGAAELRDLRPTLVKAGTTPSGPFGWFPVSTSRTWSRIRSTSR